VVLDREQVARLLDQHELEYIDPEVGYVCGCDEYGNLFLPYMEDASMHRADALIAALLDAPPEHDHDLSVYCSTSCPVWRLQGLLPYAPPDREALDHQPGCSACSWQNQPPPVFCIPCSHRAGDWVDWTPEHAFLAGPVHKRDDLNAKSSGRPSDEQMVSAEPDDELEKLRKERWQVVAMRNAALNKFEGLQQRIEKLCDEADEARRRQGDGGYVDPEDLRAALTRRPGGQ
jgi:hypothetical protein